MCGIAGLFNCDAIDASSILSRLSHRGPDGDGSMEIGAGSHLFHTRLSIIDLSDAGHQPMRDARSGNVIVFNGEIYNFRELRRELDDGEPWESHSDTEVILRAWRRWGVDSLPKLRGMFAFALWDASSRALFLARDRLGIKPLYFARRGTSFAFASEMRALLATGIVEKRVDPASLGEYLRYQSAVGAGCLVAGARMLEPGVALTVGP